MQIGAYFYRLAFAFHEMWHYQLVPRFKTSQFEGLACCCHGDQPLHPLTLEVSAGLEWGLLGLTCEWLVRGGFYLSAPLINTVSLSHREHTLPHAHTLIPLSHSRAGVIISDNPHWQTVNSSYCTLLLTKHTTALHGCKVLTKRYTAIHPVIFVWMWLHSFCDNNEANVGNVLLWNSAFLYSAVAWVVAQVTLNFALWVHQP